MSEKIISACVIHPSGEKLCWPSHDEAISIATKHGVRFSADDILHNRLEKGFLTDAGRFVSREEWAEIAFAVGQVKEKIEKLCSYHLTLK